VPVLEHVARRCEHRFDIALWLVDHHIGRRAGSQMSAILQPQNACGPGARHDRDLVERVLSGNVLERGLCRRIGLDRRQHVVAKAAIGEQFDQMRIAGERPAIGMIGGEEHPPGILHQQEQLESDRPL
jgi:hypothetical protein